MNTAYYRAEKPADRRWVMVELVTRFPKADYMHDYLNLLLDGSTDERTYTNAVRFAYSQNLLKKGSQYTDLAEKLLNQGSPTEALEVLEAGVAAGVLKPSDTLKSLTDLAKPAAAEDRKATPSLDKEARAKQNGEMDVKLGLAYVGQKHYDKAVEAISRGLQPGRIAKVKRVDESQLLLGYSYYKLGRLEEARAAFTEAAKDPRATELVKLWLAVCVPPAAPALPAEAAPAAPTVVPAPAPAKS